jgi:hypothetical protein
MRPSDRGTSKFLVMLPRAVLPDRSLSLALAAAQISSLAPSSSIHWSDEDMIDVRYRGTPARSICLEGGLPFPVALVSEGGFNSRFFSVSSSVEADGRE